MMKNYVLTFFLFMLTIVVSAQSENETAEKSVEITMDNFVLRNAVTMYPNPVERYLTVHSSFPITRILVFSLLGDQVLDVKNNFNRIDLREINSGIYMIKVYSNQYSVTKKLIKK